MKTQEKMNNNSNEQSGSQNQEAQNERNGSGKQGFAAMPKERVREIAREGGRHSHDNDNNRAEGEGSSGRSSQNQEAQNERSGSGKQGFAAMPKERVREIAREGGKHSHDNDNN